MLMILIALIILAGGAALAWLIFVHAPKQEAERAQTELGPLRSFCALNKFQELPDPEKHQVWSKIKEFVPRGPLLQGLTSSRETGAELVAGRRLDGVQEYVILQKSVRHQASGTQRYLAGIFVEINCSVSSTLYFLSKSMLNTLGSLGEDWNKIRKQGHYIVYSTQNMAEGLVDQVLSELQSLEDPLPNVTVDQHGFFINYTQIGSAPDSSHDYQRLLNIGQALRNILK